MKHKLLKQNQKKVQKIKNCGIEKTKEDSEKTNEMGIGKEIGEDETKGDSSATILVHIAGAVQKEGIIELSSDSRLADAIEKAGGLKENADMEKINLAYHLEDGIKIYIPSKSEKQKEENSSKDETEKYITKSGDSKHEATQNNIKININTATQTELETIPGIGPSTALKIIKYREENKKFKSIEEIKEVSGIGESKYNSIKDKITVK